MPFVDPPALVAGSLALWLTLLVILRSKVLAVLAVLVLCLSAAILNNQASLDTTWLTGAAWLILLLAAIASTRTAYTIQDASIARFVAIGAGLLFISVLIGVVSNQKWLAGLGACILWFSTTVLSRIRSNRQTLKKTSPSEEALDLALRQLRSRPERVVEDLANRVLTLVNNSDAGLYKRVGVVARELGEEWQQIWIVAAILRELDELNFDVTDLSPSASIHKRQPNNDARGIGQALSTPLILHVGDIIASGGIKELSGDHYHIENSNISGIVGRNKVSNTTTGRQSDLSLAVSDLSQELRRVAALVDATDSDDLTSAAQELDETEEPGKIRKIVQQVLGIASNLGPEALSILKLGRTVLEQVTSR